MSVTRHDPSLASWRTSSYSTHEGQCVEVGTWRTSSYSTGEGQCVEVGWSVDAVGVRDTKNRAAGHFAVRPATWRTFTHAVAHDALR